MSIENQVADIVLKAGSLPGFRVHPQETYSLISTKYGLSNISTPRDLYQIHSDRLKFIADELISSEKKKLAMIGFATGLPGGVVGITAGTVVDLSAYIRTAFVLSQRVAHVYGVIPNPYVDEIESDPELYFESAKEAIFKSVLIGLGAGLGGKLVTEVSQTVAKNVAKTIVRKPIQEVAITQLAKQIGKVVGKNFTKQGISKVAGKAIPILGGVVGASINWAAMRMMGNRLINELSTEHQRLRAEFNPKEETNIVPQHSSLEEFKLTNEAAQIEEAALAAIINMALIDGKIDPAEQDLILGMISMCSLDPSRKEALIDRLDSSVRKPIDLSVFEKSPTEKISLMIGLVNIIRADVKVCAEERIFLRSIGRELNIPEEEMKELLAMLDHSASDESIGV